MEAMKKSKKQKVYLTALDSIQGGLRKINEILPAWEVKIINLPTWGPKSKVFVSLSNEQKLPWSTAKAMKVNVLGCNSELYRLARVDRMIAKRSAKMVDF